RKQHHKRQSDGAHDDLRKSNIRRLKDEKHERQQQSVKREPDHLAQGIAGEHYSRTGESDEDKDGGLNSDHRRSGLELATRVNLRLGIQAGGAAVADAANFGDV